MSERDIFIAALQKENPAERSAYLEQACAGDEALRRRVEVLLQAHAKAGSFLERPAPDAGATADSRPGQSADEERVRQPRSAAPAAQTLSEGPGTRIGPYKLLQQLGEGGMGVVYMAEQEQPVRRRVALKIIKAGMDSAQVVARFEQERQALALMDHPHIAKVLDAGATETGRPYFVMELVKGLPITKFCDQEQLTPRERLELFIPVCQAVQHAHQKGIIHRDLKPSNVLIALYDGKPVPKVIDFGIAKATGQRLTERTMFTEVGSIVGTLEYMSPEQAELNNLDIDTRADIYSLGVLLYELLTGAPPFTAKQLRSAAFTEMLRIIREVEPPKPSTKLSSSDELPSIAAKRKLEPKRLTKLVQGDLDWIVMKCLAKERNRRYETANGVASDIERYLHEEPVRAGPPGAGYQLRKFARRYKKPLAAAGVFVALLLGGVVVSTMQAVRASRAEARARTERDAAQEARERADRHFALAKDAVDKYLSKVTDNPKLTQADFHQLRKELLETALPFYQQFAEQESQDPELRAARGQAYRRLARLRAEMGDRETVLVDYWRALEILEPLVAEFPAMPHYRLALGESQRSFGQQLSDLGRRAEAEDQFRRALSNQQQLVADFPTVQEYRIELASSYTSLGLLLRDLGRLAEAGVQQRQALALVEKLAADFPTLVRYHRAVGATLNNLAMVLEVTGQRTEAVALYEQAIRYQEQALVREPQDARSRFYLANHRYSLGDLLSSLGRRAEAVDHHRKGLAVREKLAADFPSVPLYRDTLGGHQATLGLVLADLGQWEEAEVQHRQALALREKLAADFPTAADYQRDVAGTLHNLALVLARIGQRTEALALFERALRHERQALERDPQDDLARQFLQEHHLALGQLLAQLSRRTEAEAQLRQALAVGEKPVADPQVERSRRRSLAGSHSSLGRLLAELGQWDEAEAQGRQALALQDKRVSDSPDLQDPVVDRAGSYALRADLVRDQGRPQEALEGYAKAVAVLEPILAKEKRLVEAREALRDAHAGRARALDRLGRHAEAIADWERALELDAGPNRPVLQLGRAISRAHVRGDHRQAFAEAETLAKDADGPTLEGLARLCALASVVVHEGQKSAEAAAIQEQYAARAVELLRQAAGKGHRDSAYLKEGTDLAALRQRADFQQLLADSEESLPAIGGKR